MNTAALETTSRIETVRDPLLRQREAQLATGDISRVTSKLWRRTTSPLELQAERQRAQHRLSVLANNVDVADRARRCGDFAVAA